MFYYRCVSGGEHPAHWQDHCLDFWSPQLCFSFHLNPRPAAEEMTIWGGKQQRLITPPPTYSHSPLDCPFLHPWMPLWSLSVDVACSTSRPTPQSATLLVSSAGLRPLTHEIDTSLCLAQTQEAHTLADLVSPLLSLCKPCSLSRVRNLGCVPQLQVHDD